jgi:ABC-type sugar transport system substrate-binding protein
MRHRLIFLFCLMFVSFGIIFAQTGKNNSSQKKITIGLIGKIGTNSVFIAAHSGAKLAAKELGAKYNVDVVIDWATPEKENVQEQAAAIERLTRSGASGIAIACSDAKYLTPVIDEAVDKEYRSCVSIPMHQRVSDLLIMVQTILHSGKLL